MQWYGRNNRGIINFFLTVFHSAPAFTGVRILGRGCWWDITFRYRHFSFAQATNKKMLFLRFRKVRYFIHDELKSKILIHGIIIGRLRYYHLTGRYGEGSAVLWESFFVKARKDMSVAEAGEGIKKGRHFKVNPVTVLPFRHLLPRINTVTLCSFPLPEIQVITETLKPLFLDAMVMLR